MYLGEMSKLLRAVIESKKEFALALDFEEKKFVMLFTPFQSRIVQDKNTRYPVTVIDYHHQKITMEHNIPPIIQDRSDFSTENHQLQEAVINLESVGYKLFNYQGK